MEISPLKYTRAHFGEAMRGMSDADVLAQYIQQKKIDPSTDLNTVIEEMETIGRTKINEAQAASQLKATRRLLGDQVLGVADEEIIRDYASQMNLPSEMPLESVVKTMEGSARRGLFEQDRRQDEDQVNSVFALPQAVADAKDSLGLKGQSLFTSEDIGNAINIHAVENFLKPADARDGFVERVAKEAAVLGLPFFARQGKRAGQWLARQGAEDPERMKDLDRIENILTDPDAIARYVSEISRYKENPELFTEEEVENLKQATLAYETTSQFFDVEASTGRNLTTGAIESLAFPIIKSMSNLAGSAANAFGFDREFTDDALRQLNFTDQVLSEQDDDSKAAIAGSILGSAAQTVMMVLSGVGAPGLFAVYGAQGASGNIEQYRQFVRSKGLDPSVGEEAFVALGGMAISGGLAALLTGKTIGQIPAISKWTKGAERELFKQAIQGGTLSAATANLSRQSLFGRGVEIARNVLSNPELIKASAKSYAKFAAATAPVEGFEEISEAVLNEGLMNLAVDKYETDPDAFLKEILISGIGGLVGGAAVGPAARRRYSSQVENTSRNVLGLEHLAAASPEQARQNLAALQGRVFQIQELYGRIPAPIVQEYATMRDKLQGVASGEIKVSEAFTPEELANGGNNVLSVGDILSKADLRGTAIFEAADKVKSEKTAGVSSNQRDAHRQLIQYFENSDLAEQNPELVQQVLDRIYLTPLSTGTGRRVAATTTALGNKKDGTVGRQFMGVYLTNGADATAVHDEIFHILNDSRSDLEQQQIVDAYNKIYKTNYGSYTDPKTRDQIAKKAAAIITGKERAKSTDSDNEFVRIVQAQMDGLISEINPGLQIFDSRAARQDVFNPQGNGIPVSGDEIMRAVRAGEMRRVGDVTISSRPNVGDRILFQDNDGVVFTYDSVIDSEGNEQGVLTPIEMREILPTVGPNMVTALQTFPKDIVRREAGPIAVRNVPDVEFEIALEPDPNAFYVDNAGNIIEFENGVPIKAFEVVMATDANGNTFEIMRPVDVDLSEVKRLYEAGQLLLEGTEPGPQRPADFIGNLLAVGKVAPPLSSPIFNIRREYLQAKEDQLPPNVRQELEKMAAKQQEQQDAADALAEETGVVKYAETEPAPNAQPKNVATPRLSDLVITIPSNIQPAIVEALMSGEVLAVDGLKSVGEETDPVTGFRLVEVTNDKLLSDLLDANLIVPGRVLIGDTITDTIDTVVSFNPDALNQEAIDTLNNQTETVVPSSREFFFEVAMPTKGPGSRGGKLKFIYIVDQDGNKEAFQSKTSAINALNNRTTSEVTSEPGAGSSDTIYAGVDIYTTESASATVQELIEQELGDSIDTIGNLLFTTDATSEEYETLRKAAKKFVKQVINKAVGNARYTPETFDAARKALFNAMIDIQDAPVSEAAVEAVVESQSEPQATEPPVDTTDSKLRRIIRDMRRAVKRDALSRTSVATGSLEFTTKQKKSANIFADKIAELGATDATTRMEEVDGKTTFVVTATIHPDIASDIFNNSDEVAQRAENPVEITAVAPEVEFNPPGRKRKKRSVPEETFSIVEEEVEVATPEQVVEKKKRKRIRKQKIEAVEIAEQIVEDEGTQADKDRVARKKKSRAEVIEKPKRVTLATFNNFVEIYGEDAEIKVKTEARGSGTATVMSYRIDGEEIAVHTIYESGVERFTLSPNYIIQTDESAEVGTNYTASEAASVANAWNKKHGFKRPIIISQTSKEINELLEDFAETFQFQSQLYYFDTSILEGVDLENAKDAISIIQNSASIPNDVARLIYREAKRILKAGEKVTSGLHTWVTTDEPFHVVMLSPQNVIKTVGGPNAGIEVIKSMAYDTVVHELGHALMYSKGGAASETENVALFEAWQSSLNDLLTLEEYIERYMQPHGIRTTYGVINQITESKKAIDIIAQVAGLSLPEINALRNTLAKKSNITMRDFKVLNPARYAYLTSYEEWFARQFQRWAVSGEVETTGLSSIFKSISDLLKTFFHKYFRAGNISSDKSFESWMQTLIETAGRPQPNETHDLDGFATTASQEDAMHQTLVDYHMMPAEMQARNDNQIEMYARDNIYDLRARLSDSVWKGIEKAVRAGEEVTGSEDEVRYAEFFKAAMDMASNRRLEDSDDIPIDVMVSYASAASLFPAALSERMEQVWNKYRNSFINDARRRLFSPIIVRARVLAEDHPDIPILKELVRRTSAIPGENAAEIPYTDAILKEITTRTSDVTKTLNPIFRHFGYKGSTIQKVGAAFLKSGEIGGVLDMVFRGIRDKNLLTQEKLDKEYDGITLNQIIDAVREQMDNLANYAAQETEEGNPNSRLIDPDDFITYGDEDQHYVPRVYNKEVVIENIDYFREFIIKRNLERVYRQDAYLQQRQEELGRKLTIAEEEEFKNSVPDNFELSENDSANIASIAEAITNKIAYGRSFNVASVFNPDYQPGHNLAQIIEQFGENVPDRLKKRRLWFVPDNELLGEVEINGKKINFLDTNIVTVLSNAISGIVKRVEFAKAYGKRGELFAEAEGALRQKIIDASGDPRQINKLRRDIDAVRGLFESVAEIVDASKVGTRRFINEAPIRNTVRVFSKMTTVAVMGLSSFLAIAETGNMFIRTGFKGGMIGMAKFAEIAAKKTFRWPAAALGFIDNYTDSMELEMTALGYLHEVGEDVMSRVRFDPFYDEGRDPMEGSVAENNGSLVNKITNVVDYLEDAFYRVTMLEQITRVSQIAAAHASNVLIKGLRDAHYSEKGYNSAQKRELKRLGFVNKDGELDMEQVQEYVEFFNALEEARSNGVEATEQFANNNERMFKDVHYRVMGRLITQQITRPNVASRTVWSNSQNPLVRAASRLRSFTWGYRSHIATFFTDEARGLYEDKDLAGIASFFTRFLPILMLAFMTVVAREELKADIHEFSGNSSQAETIRTRMANRTTAETILDTVDKTGLTLQASDLINAVEGAQYGAGLFATVFGVSASRAEKMYEAAMRSAYTGDPAFLINGTTSSVLPAGNTGIWDFARLELQSSEAKMESDANFYGSVGW